MPTANMAVPVKYIWVNQTRDRIDENPPVQNTWYTVLDESDVRMVHLSAMQDNNEAAVKIIESRFTIDGVVESGSASFNNATMYLINQCGNPAATVGANLIAQTSEAYASTWYGLIAHALKIEIRITSALGTAQRLRADCIWEKLEQVSP